MVKLGVILLVTMPLSALGPVMPLKLRFSNNSLEALLTATSEERSKE